MFTDDTQIYLDCVPSEPNLALAKVKHDVNIISNYSVKNGLKLNLTKSKIMVLGSPTYINAIDPNMLIDLTIDNTAIP